VVDLCCGSGAVGAALATMLERIEMYAVDIDPVAVRCARRNINSAGGQVMKAIFTIRFPLNFTIASTLSLPMPPMYLLRQ
jgi:methylase of polypeptide subunit release factors